MLVGGRMVGVGPFQKWELSKGGKVAVAVVPFADDNDDNDFDSTDVVDQIDAGFERTP